MRDVDTFVEGALHTRTEPDLVRAVLAHQGRTQRWFAARLGVSVHRVTRLLTGEATYSEAEAERAALVLGVPAAILFPAGRVAAWARKPGPRPSGPGEAVA